MHDQVLMLHCVIMLASQAEKGDTAADNGLDYLV